MNPEGHPIRVRVDAEDALLAAMGERLLGEFGGKFQMEGAAQIWGGKSKLNEKIPGWNRGAPFSLPRLALRDLDSRAPPDDARNCPASESARLLGKAEKSPNLILRFAVVESESWLLADGDALADFLEAGAGAEIFSADAVGSPKERLIALARKSRRRAIRMGIPPRPGGGRGIGVAYNHILSEFVSRTWNPKRAAERSKSLRRTLDCLENFEPR